MQRAAVVSGGGVLGDGAGVQVLASRTLPMTRGQAEALMPLLEAVLRAAGYRPSLPLAMQADKILACAESHGLSNLRVFGSSVRGEDDFDSDIDLLVTPSTSTDLFDLALFVDDVERLTGFPADVVSDSPYLFS